MSSQGDNRLQESAIQVLADKVQSAFGERLRRTQHALARRLYLEVEPAEIVESARIMFVDFGGRLQTITAADAPKEIEILYHWALDSTGLVVTVRTRVDRDKPEIASITSVCEAAEWIEREMWELMGVEFPGHPDLRHLLLQDDWPEGSFPLRRDYRKA